jgi:Outer membrane protein beta-barrel domain
LIKSISPEEEIFMVRRLSFLLGLVFLFSMTAHAQSSEGKFDLFGGYSYLRLDSTPTTNMNGFDVSGQYKVTDWLGGVADLSGNYRFSSSDTTSASLYTFLVGPQITRTRGRLSPFAHVLVGFAHFGGGGVTSSSFSVALGGGIDAKLTHSLSWRVIQADYLRTGFVGLSQNNVRASTGIVLRF